MTQAIFDTIIGQRAENDNTFNDVSAVQFSYKTYRVDFYSYDLVNFTPSVDNFGRTAKNGEWIQYEPTQEQIEKMRNKLEANWNAYMDEKEEEERRIEENSWTQADRDHVASLWNKR